MTDSPDPENLWKALEVYEQKTGGRVMASPHNGNLSNGEMFAEVTLQDTTGPGLRDDTQALGTYL